MDYKKKYEKLVDAVKVLRDNNPSDEGIQNWVNDNVPELKESEDERIRKAILEGLIDCRDAPDLGWSNFGGIEIDDCIAWFEKQGKETSWKPSLVEEVYSHLDSIKETADRMTSGNFMHNKAAIKFSANTITKVLELIGIKTQKDSKYENKN